ncbi:hypothetical protein C8F01DRAFT_1181561 [Mycena amicta]|nr:hypothetical protein C8F01DRAFT_1181561 [Mycena amicta]
MPEWHNQFRAWITIEGEEATEYEVETSEEDRTVTCWIASELGKKFAVNWENRSFNTATEGRIYMDGVYCGGKLIFEEESLPVTRRKAGVPDEATLKPFVFSALQLTDDDGASSNLSDIGQIQLKIQPITVGEKKTRSRKFTLPSTQIHERAKKAVTQQIQLGAAEPQKTSSLYNTTRNGPYVVKIYWKYRPIDMLRANGIAPPLKRKATSLESSSISKSPAGDEEDEDAQEVKRLEEQLQAAKARMASKHGDKKPRIKGEYQPVIFDGARSTTRGPRRRSNGRAGLSEVIDLT